MKKLKGWLVLGGLALLATTASADYNVRDHVTHNQNASTGLRVDDTGNLTTVDQDRDRDFPLIEQLFSGQALNPGETYAMTTSWPSRQFSRAAIMLSWGIAAADTDSVRIAVRVYGATSATSGNWYAWTPGGLSASDSCVGAAAYGAADTTATSVSRCLSTNVAFWVQKANLGVGPQPRLSYLASHIVQGTATKPAAGQIVLRKIPLPIMRFSSANGVMLNLTDNYGAPCPFPYIRIEVTNAGRQALTNVEANIWTRVQ